MLRDCGETRSHLSSEFQCRAFSSFACACCSCLCSRTLCMGLLGRLPTGSVGSTFFCKGKARQMVTLERTGERPWVQRSHS